MNKDTLRQRIQENKIMALQRSNKPNFPSNIQMAKNLGSDIIKNIKSVASGNPLNVPNDVLNNRKSICNSCEFYDKIRERCLKCGCNMAVKTYLKASTCPIGKW
jgi:predicted Zn-ribbon and HTH transcriptional regulator